jgi:hypothetical protein
MRETEKEEKDIFLLYSIAEFYHTQYNLTGESAKVHIADPFGKFYTPKQKNNHTEVLFQSSYILWEWLSILLLQVTQAFRRLLCSR